MACGTAVISTDCPYGPNEIIQSGKNGILIPVDDVQSLSNATVNLLTNIELRKKIIREAFDSIKRLDYANIIRQYESIFL